MLAFDLVSAQGSLNGGAEYARAVFYALMAHSEVPVAALFDGQQVFDPELRQECESRGVKLVNVHEIDAIVWINESCTAFFVPIAQRYVGRGLSRLTVPCMIVVHDLRDLEFADFHRRWWPRNWWDAPRLLRSALRNLAKLTEEDRHAEVVRASYDELALVWQRPTTTVITDSHHSRVALDYYFGPLKPVHVEVLCPPVRRMRRAETISETIVAQLVQGSNPWLLVLGGNRPEKNVLAFLLQAPRFFQDHPEFRVLIVGRLPDTLAKLANRHPQILNLDALNESDLGAAYESCFALIYPSLGEGFGYPPLEAMAAGRPVIASNVTSLPEVLGDSALLFNPHSEVELYGRLQELIANYDQWCSRSRQWSENMSAQQARDLETLVSRLIGLTLASKS